MSCQTGAQHSQSRTADRDTTGWQVGSAYDVQILSSHPDGKGEVVHHVINGTLGLEQIWILIEEIPKQVKGERLPQLPSRVGKDLFVIIFPERRAS